VATAAPKRPETPPSLSVSRQTPRRRFRCIAIHPLKSYQRRFGRFWRGKPWISSSSGEKRAEWFWGDAVNRCYGKCGSLEPKKAALWGRLFTLKLFFKKTSLRFWL